MMAERRSIFTAKNHNLSFVNLGLTVVLLVSAVLACSSGSSKTCSATLTLDGQTFVGQGDADKRPRFARNKYCVEADPGYDAVYRAWIDSPAGKAAERPSKQEAIYKDKKLMDYVTVSCANECLAKVRDGKAKVETKCE